MSSSSSRMLPVTEHQHRKCPHSVPGPESYTLHINTNRLRATNCPSFGRNMLILSHIPESSVDSVARWIWIKAHEISWLCLNFDVLYFSFSVCIYLAVHLPDSTYYSKMEQAMFEVWSATACPPLDLRGSSRHIVHCCTVPSLWIPMRLKEFVAGSWPVEELNSCRILSSKSLSCALAFADSMTKFTRFSSVAGSSAATTIPSIWSCRPSCTQLPSASATNFKSCNE